MEVLNDMLERNVRSIGKKTFIVSDEETLTYEQFNERVSQLANVLVAHGVMKGDTVGLYLPSRPIMVAGFWACQKIGAIPVPMSAMYRETELRHALQLTGMKVLLTDASGLRQIAQVRGDFPALAHVLADEPGVPGIAKLADLMASASATFNSVPGDAEDIAALFFTSGTSGAPKGTVQTQLNQYSTLRDMMVSHRTRFGAEVYYCAAPLFSNLGMTVTVNLCMFTGGTVILSERWNTEQVFAAIMRHGVTLLSGTPTMFVYMVNDFDPARHDLSTLRLCTNGGAPVSAAIAQRFEEISGARVIQVYGATETLGQNVMEPVIGIRKPGSAGVPVGSSGIDIIDDAGNSVPAGTVGEVVISGDCVARGYWRDEAAASKSFTARGWLSGDLGFLDADGYLFIVDRKKEVIIAGGHNIYPLEVENVLYRHSGVAVCAVVGIPDEIKGEIPVAVVVPRQQQGNAQEIIDFCRENLSVYKAPRRVFFVEEMPVSAGKIRKRDLVRWIAEGLLQAS